MSPARVLLDGMQLRHGHGVARTLKAVLPALAGSGFEAIVVTTPDAAQMLADFDVETLLAPKMSNILWEQIGLPWYAHKVRAKALYSHRACAPTTGPPTLLYYLDDPQEAAARGATATTPRERVVRVYQRLSVGPAVRHAAVVATYTEVAAQSLRARFGRSLRQLEVVPLGVDPSTFYPDRSENQPESIFHLGSWEPRDQTELVVRAYALAVAQRPDLPRLVIAGRLGALEMRVRRAAEEGGVQDRVVYLGGVSDRELRRGYSAAAVCIQPSLYESFGLTTLEAIACGAPLVVVAEPAVQEVVGGAAVVVPERSSAPALANGLLHLWDRPDERQRLHLAGPQRASRFTWSRTGTTICRLLAELVK